MRLCVLTFHAYVVLIPTQQLITCHDISHAILLLYCMKFLLKIVLHENCHCLSGVLIEFETSIMLQYIFNCIVR